MINVKTPPTGDIISVTEIKIYLKVDSDQTVEDTLIQSQLDGVISEIEIGCNVALLIQTIEEYYDCWSNAFLLTRGPVSAVTNIDYLKGGVWTTYELTDCAFDLVSKIPRVQTKVWVEPDLEVNSVRITYTSGFTTVPAYVLGAIRLKMADLYLRRDDMPFTGKASDYIRISNLMLRPLKQRYSRA